MKILIDEMYPPAIAEQLRDRGHDVQAITERAELRGLADDDIFAAAQQERRALVTENIADFSIIADRLDERGQPHHGLIVVDPAKYPRGDPRTIGKMVRSLEGLLSRHSTHEASSLRHWLWGYLAV